MDILSWLLRDARGELGVRISNVFSQVTRDRYQLNLRVRSWAHSRAQSVGVYRPSPLASAAAPAKCFHRCTIGRKLRHLGASGLCAPLSFTDGLSAVADFSVGSDHPTAAGGGHTKRPPLFPAGASLVPAQLRVAWNSLVASYKSPRGFCFPLDRLAESGLAAIGGRAVENGHCCVVTHRRGARRLPTRAVSAG